MPLLEWKNSFSVGVSVLDADHRRLVDLINELHDARQTNRTGDVFRSIIGSLKDHLVSHAEREEALMSRLGYQELESHSAHHAEAVTSLERLLAAGAGEDGNLPGQVLDFMKAWFANHVICTDLKMREFFIQHGAADVKVADEDISVRGIFQKIGRKLDWMGLRARIILLGVVPFLAFLAVMAWMVADRIHSANALAQMEEIATLGTEVGGLVHNLQIERGMTALFLSSKGAKFASELEGQRKATDAMRFEFDKAAQHAAMVLAGSEAGEQLAKALTGLDALGQKRQSVTALQVTTEDAIGYYTSVINDHLAMIDKLVSLTPNAALLRNIISYSSLLNMKERAGRERAVLSGVLAAGNFSTESFQRFMELGAAQKTYEQMILSLSEHDFGAKYRQTVTGPVVDSVAQIRAEVVSSILAGGTLNVTPDAWFKAATDRINLLKSVEDQSAQTLLTGIAGAHASASQQADTLIGLSVIVLILLLVLSLTLVGSVVPPLAPSPEACAVWPKANGPSTSPPPPCGTRSAWSPRPCSISRKS